MEDRQGAWRIAKKLETKISGTSEGRTINYLKTKLYYFNCGWLIYWG